MLDRGYGYIPCKELRTTEYFRGITCTYVKGQASRGRNLWGSQFSGGGGDWYLVLYHHSFEHKARRGCLQGWCFVFGIFDRAANQKQCKWYVCNMLYLTQSQRAASIFIVKLNLVCNGEPWKQSLLQVPGSHIWETKSHANQGLSKKEQGVVMWQRLKIHKAQS